MNADAFNTKALEEEPLDEYQQSEAGTISPRLNGTSEQELLAMGSEAELVLRGSPVPVLLVRQNDHAG